MTSSTGFSYLDETLCSLCFYMDNCRDSSESSNNNLTADLVTLLFYTKTIGTTINCCENVIIIILIKDCSEKKDDNKGVEEVWKDLARFCSNPHNGKIISHINVYCCPVKCIQGQKKVNCQWCSNL